MPNNGIGEEQQEHFSPFLPYSEITNEDAEEEAEVPKGPASMQPKYGSAWERRQRKRLAQPKEGQLTDTQARNKPPLDFPRQTLETPS